jgi:hypothetical protein
MSRQVGYDALVKVDITSTASGTLSTLSFTTTYTIDETAADVDLSAFGDTSQIHGRGLPDQKITLAGHTNLGADALDVLTDGKARGCSITPAKTNFATSIFSGGTYTWSKSITGSVSGGVEFSLIGLPASSGSWTSI